MTFDEWMLCYTGGKYKETDDCLLEMQALRACWTAAAATTQQAIIEAMGSMLHCPCCGESMDCPDDCTFAVDCPDEAQQMAVLRDAVRG